MYIGEVFVMTLSMPIYSNFQINGASGETFKVFVAIFTTIKVECLSALKPSGHTSHSKVVVGGFVVFVG